VEAGGTKSATACKRSSNILSPLLFIKGSGVDVLSNTARYVKKLFIAKP